MTVKKCFKKRTKRTFLRCLFAVILTLMGAFSIGAVTTSERAYAEPDDNASNVVVDTTNTTDEAGTNKTNTTDTTNTKDGAGASDATVNATDRTNTNASNTTTNTTDSTDEKNKISTGDGCQKSLEGMAWIVCSATDTVSGAVDWLYEKIEDFLVINPVEAKDGAPIYEIWKYFRGFTNIVFIILMLVVIYSQLTGVGISNYGVKKSLPKLIVAAVLVNLSFLICQLGVDLSNIIGNGLREMFVGVQDTVMASMEVSEDAMFELKLTYAHLYNALAAGGLLTVGLSVLSFENGTIWMFIPVILGALVAVASGFITIALRQAVVALLVMIAPLAIVAMMLPNTENLFKKWRKLLLQMLVFYPMFSLLFGASRLAGFAIMASAKDGLWLLLGMAVQVFPLFFSWTLLKMSGTVLGTINTRIRGLAAGPLARNRAWAESRRQRTRAYNMQYSMMPYSRLQRYLDNRRALREKETENLQQMRKNDANIYVQKKIGAGYDGSKTTETKGELKPNKHTKIAKDAMNKQLENEYVTLDTAHTLGQYDQYFISKDTRRLVAAAEKANNKALANKIKESDTEYQRAIIGGRNFLELNRAQMTAENDNEADFNYMVSQFLGASTGYDPNARGERTEENLAAMQKYRHYIVSSAGGLGETGQTRVLGKIIAKAAAVESNQRRDISIVANKFPPDKRNFRNFLFNYYIDDDGYATDKEGNRIEHMRDYLRVNDPSKLVQWDKYDENGPYYDWYDTNGKYVTRIYKKDKPAIKELMSNFDAPINDPINNLLAIHAGIKEQPNSEISVLQNMGLDSFRTTVGRALMGASFKEKNAAFSPMVAEMVKKGYIKNYAQEYLAYLDSFNKATKPGAFNMQDGDAIQMFIDMMDPDKWEDIFPTELIRGYQNVNGEHIYGIRYDENGDRIKVPYDVATREELMERIKEKFIYPAAPKILASMSRQTQNTMDNQKVGNAALWKKLKQVLDTKWGPGKEIDKDPYKQDGDMRMITRDIRDAMYTVDENGNRQKFNTKKNHNAHSDENGAARKYRNHAANIYEIYNSALDADDFAVAVSEYCANYMELGWVANQLQDYITSEGYGVTKEQLYEKVEELLAYVDYD